MSEPINVKMTEADKIVGKFVVLWRNEKKQPCKVVEVDIPGKRVKYELIAGPEKGKQWWSRYDESQNVLVYDDDNLMLALLET